MNWWQLLLGWLGGWLFIILLNLVNHSVDSYEDETDLVEKDLVGDGNELFKTGLTYFSFNLFCQYVNSPILSWAVMIFSIVCCIPPILSIVRVVAKASFLRGKFWLIVVSAVVCDFVPLAMALNILQYT